jgi:NADH-quinone oxidoreductase subunit G
VAVAAAGEIAYPIADFYLTNPIARASETLAALLGRTAARRIQAEAAE